MSYRVNREKKNNNVLLRPVHTAACFRKFREYGFHFARPAICNILPDRFHGTNDTFPLNVG